METQKNSRDQKIKELEELAREVLTLKNRYRQRRPIVIEFCGSPKAGKTSSITSLNIFLKRNGFKTAVLTERASTCPITDKQSPIFNVWTCSATINEINSKMDDANYAQENGEDIILCDRGIFDSLCWFRWLNKRSKMSAYEYDVLTQFSLLNRWQKNIDLVYVFLSTPEESIKREYANLLTTKRGSIMNEDILAQYKEAVEETLTEYSNRFRATHVVDTTDREQNDVGYEVTKQTLETLREMLMEKIGYVHLRNLTLQSGMNRYTDLKSGLEKICYGLRDMVEANDEYVQPIAIATIIDEYANKVFVVKKTQKSTGEDSPEYGRTLLYIGGHMRVEDSVPTSHDILDVIRNTLERELYEELGISVSIDRNEEPFIIYTPNSDKSRKHLAIGWVVKMKETSKFRLDAYELVQKKGKSKSGTFVSFSDCTTLCHSLETWSRNILLNIFGEKLTSDQQNILIEYEPEQLSIDINDSH